MKVGDRVELLENYGTVGLVGDQGTVTHIGEDATGGKFLISVDLDKKRSIVCYNFRLKVVESKATLEDAENLLAMIDQLEDSEAELKEAKEAFDLAELDVAILKEKIAALKEKLNIA